MQAKSSLEAVRPYLDEEDFEQMRIETRQLVVENEELRRRIAHLERQIVTHGWAGFKLH
jgi:PHD/YefM family antitoxin component YafN of YafNO toxin-antitoxin module